MMFRVLQVFAKMTMPHWINCTTETVSLFWSTRWFIDHNPWIYCISLCTDRLVHASNSTGMWRRPNHRVCHGHDNWQLGKMPMTLTMGCVWPVYRKCPSWRIPSRIIGEIRIMWDWCKKWGLDAALWHNVMVQCILYRSIRDHHQAGFQWACSARIVNGKGPLVARQVLYFGELYC